MARKRVIAHYMHEYEAGQVVPELSDSVVTEGFAIGEIDEDRIADLEKKGIVFEDLTETPPAALETPEASERVMAAAFNAMPSADFAADFSLPAFVPGPPPLLNT